MEAALTPVLAIRPIDHSRKSQYDNLMVETITTVAEGCTNETVTRIPLQAPNPEVTLAPAPPITSTPAQAPTPTTTPVPTPASAETAPPNLAATPASAPPRTSPPSTAETLTRLTQGPTNTATIPPTNKGRPLAVNYKAIKAFHAANKKLTANNNVVQWLQNLQTAIITHNWNPNTALACLNKQPTNRRPQKADKVKQNKVSAETEITHTRPKQSRKRSRQKEENGDDDEEEECRFVTGQGGARQNGSGQGASRRHATCGTVHTFGYCPLMRCYNCQEMGHTSAYCTHRKRPRTGTPFMTNNDQEMQQGQQGPPLPPPLAEQPVRQQGPAGAKTTAPPPCTNRPAMTISRLQAAEALAIASNNICAWRDLVKIRGPNSTGRQKWRKTENPITGVTRDFNCGPCRLDNHPTALCHMDYTKCSFKCPTVTHHKTTCQNPESQRVTPPVMSANEHGMLQGLQRLQLTNPTTPIPPPTTRRTWLPIHASVPNEPAQPASTHFSMSPTQLQVAEAVAIAAEDLNTWRDLVRIHTPNQKHNWRKTVHPSSGLTRPFNCRACELDNHPTGLCNRTFSNCKLKCTTPTQHQNQCLTDSSFFI
jgi:hypothetical protein